MSTDRVVHTAVIGLGYWGPNLVRILHASPRAELVAVHDVQQHRQEAIVAGYPGTRPTSSYAEILEDGSIDAVVIATPVSTHFHLGAAALAAGKHVFMEKPLAHSVEAGVRLAEMAAERDLVLMPGHTFLYSPPVVLVKQLIDAGVLGDVYFVSMSRVNLGLHQPDASVVWDLAPHDFAILTYWLDEAPTEVAALARDCVIPGTPDVAFINLRFSSRTIAHVELAWLSPSKLRRTAIVGSEKMVVYDDTSNEPVRIFDSGAAVPCPSPSASTGSRTAQGTSSRPRSTPPSRLRSSWRTSAPRSSTGRPLARRSRSGSMFSGPLRRSNGRSPTAARRSRPPRPRRATTARVYCRPSFALSASASRIGRRRTATDRSSPQKRRSPGAPRPECL